MQTISYARHRFPPDVIRHVVWLYLRFTLSDRDVEDLLAERGFEISNKTIRRWVLKFGPIVARHLRQGRPIPHDPWHLDEMVVSTIAAWSRSGNWADAAVQHDEYAASALLLRLGESSVQRSFDRVEALTNLARGLLETAAETAKDVTIATAGDIKALVSTAIDAIKMVEVLTGGVSNREDRRTGIAEEAMVLLREIEEDKRQRRSADGGVGSI
jgi:transposase-like protein